jgi:hypothetical protein
MLLGRPCHCRYEHMPERKLANILHYSSVGETENYHFNSDIDTSLEVRAVCFLLLFFVIHASLKFVYIHLHIHFNTVMADVKKIK